MVLACKNEEALSAPATLARVDAQQQQQQRPKADRMIVRTADVKIIVGDTATTLQKITAAAENAGGYVSDSRMWREGELLNATLTIRVPANELTATLAQIRGVAKRVDSETVSSSDVSQEYVDLGARLRNLEAAETELRALMTDVRARSKKASEVLEIHQQLTTIRGQIEETRGRMNYLEKVAAYSSINLTMIPDAIAKPIVQPGWQPAVILGDAGRALVVALQGMATFLIWLVVYILPIVVMLTFAAWCVWKIVRFVRYKHAT
jgi:hypothetical protein